MQVLEYEKVKECLKQYALSVQAKSKIMRLLPMTGPGMIQSAMQETTEARRILDINPSVPLTALEGVDRVMEKTGKGIVLQPEELNQIGSLLESVGRIRRYMAAMQSAAPEVSAYALSMYELAHLREEIERCICHGRVDDRASPELHRVRKKISIVDDRIKQKINSVLNAASAAGYLQDPVISTRGGRYVIPVKREYRRMVEGTVHDTSASGSTLFIEPVGIAKLQEEMNILKIEEENEVYRVLSTLTGLVDGAVRELSVDIETLVQYDFLFAKAKYSRDLGGCAVLLDTEGKIVIHGGRHPLIGKSAIPLDFHIGDGYRALVITGPNTGGKTVALKTVGLMTLMVQSGLHVPVGEGSRFAIFEDVLADIGDGQSIEQSLSTFSSHVRNISAILACAGPGTLVVMDEMGAGTDPGEGMGFAVAVLEAVYEKGAAVLATTHFSEIKEFAEKTPGFRNGRMEFDIHTLKPLYRLTIGQAGESNAFLIALRLGVDARIIERAHEVTYREKREYRYKELAEGTANGAAPGAPARTPDTSAGGLQTGPAAKRQPNSGTHSTVEPGKKELHFKVGDCVYVSTMKRTGIVCEPENARGEVVVMVMKNKIRISKKRLSLYIDGKELYPEAYDFDIILESKDDRKKKKLMSKRHVEGVVIERQPQ